MPYLWIVMEIKLDNGEVGDSEFENLRNRFTSLSSDYFAEPVPSTVHNFSRDMYLSQDLSNIAVALKHNESRIILDKGFKEAYIKCRDHTSGFDLALSIRNEVEQELKKIRENVRVRIVRCVVIPSRKDKIRSLLRDFLPALGVLIGTVSAMKFISPEYRVGIVVAIFAVLLLYVFLRWRLE